MLKIKNDKSVGWKEQNQRCRVKRRNLAGNFFYEEILAGNFFMKRNLETVLPETRNRF